MNIMKKLLISIAAIACIYGYLQIQPISISRFPTLTPDSARAGVLEDAFRNRTSNILVESQGIVIKILADDLDGSRHQRFIVKLSSGQTLLIAHNIDIAPRINSLQVGDSIAFQGEYEWNPQGGVVHWTHRDPDGDRIGGWIDHKGRRYR